MKIGFFLKVKDFPNKTVYILFSKTWIFFFTVQIWIQTSNYLLFLIKFNTHYERGIGEKD